MGAFIVSGLTGTLGYGVAYRTTDGDPTRASAWKDPGTTAGVVAEESRNSGDLAPMLGVKMLAQPGIKFSGTGARATLRVTDIMDWW